MNFDAIRDGRFAVSNEVDVNIEGESRMLAAVETPQQLISPDGRWYWDGRQWLPTQGRFGPAQASIAVQQRARVKYAGDTEPDEIRARFGAILTGAGFFLTLPAMFTGTIFSMAIATGQSPAWPTLGEGIFFFMIVLGLLGSWPLLGLLAGFGVGSGARWVFLCLTLSGLMPALVLGTLTLAATEVVGHDIAAVELALAWMWAFPLLALTVLRASHTGHPLPRLSSFFRMFGSEWREKIPGMQTQWGEIQMRGSRGYVLKVPGGDFTLPISILRSLPPAGTPLRVTYDLRAGWVEKIEAGAVNRDQS